MRTIVQGPFTSVMFETEPAERARRDGGGLTLAHGMASFALSMTERSDSPVSWTVRVKARMANAGAGLTDVGVVHTVSPLLGAPPTRVVAFLCVPGAFGFACEFQPDTVADRSGNLYQAEVDFGESPFIGEYGLVASQFADRETDRYNVTGGVLPAGATTTLVNPIQGRLGRVWSICVQTGGAGALISAPYGVGMVSPGAVIPIQTAGAINLHPGGGLVLPFNFDAVMPAQGGGWFVEWGE